MAVQNPYKRKAVGPIVIAHRGGGGIAPENSSFAFEQAHAMAGVDALELDIHPTSDGMIVVAHDPIVDRMTDGSGPINEKSLYELQKLDAGYRWTSDGGKTFPFRGQGLYIPLLEEIFDRYGQDKVINIDIKQRNPSIVKPFVELIRRYNMEENVVVGSFFNDTVAEFRKLAPEMATCATLKEAKRFFVLNKAGMGRAYRGKCVAFQIPEKEGRLTIITKRFIRNLQKHNVQVHVWTVNDSADMNRLLDWGVDGIITDYPDVLINLIEERGSTQ